MLEKKMQGTYVEKHGTVEVSEGGVVVKDFAFRNGEGSCDVLLCGILAMESAVRKLQNEIAALKLKRQEGQQEGVYHA